MSRAQPTVALVAHDNKKAALIDWVTRHRDALADCHLVATGTTGKQIESILPVQTRLMSGPLGGDQQLGAMIAEGKIDALIFFWDPLSAQPHDPDVKALLRLAVVWNIPTASNIATADYLLASAHWQGGYDRQRPDYGDYANRTLPR